MIRIFLAWLAVRDAEYRLRFWHEHRRLARLDMKRIDRGCDLVESQYAHAVAKLSAARLAAAKVRWQA